VATAIASPAQTYRVINKLSQPDGVALNTPLIQGLNGNLYGTAVTGGVNQSKQFCETLGLQGCGTFFEVTPAGKLTVLYNFCSQANCADGGLPSAIMLGADGNFYGSTTSGGAYQNGTFCQANTGCGTIFKITPGGQLTTLYNFCVGVNCADGVSATQLVQGFDGNLYGTTQAGGIMDGDAGCPLGCGTVFKISTHGQFTPIYKFCSKVDNGGCADGMFPGSLIQAPNGNFYGMSAGGTFGRGNIFVITPAGKLTQIYSFCSQTNCADGSIPVDHLVQATNGKLYGMTSRGGANDGGTFFQVTAAGQLTTLYSFCNFSVTSCPDGSDPATAPVQGTDGNFYGPTRGGGNTAPVLCGPGSGCGTVFEIAPRRVTGLYAFCSQSNCSDGAYPGGLTQATNGTFYGIATKGGQMGCIENGGCGTVFSLSVGLGPFVKAVPSFGRMGHNVGILGNNLTGTSSVTFNGKAAPFTVLSGTAIKAQIPTGATSGIIEVTTPGGTLKSNVAFQVLP